MKALNKLFVTLIFSSLLIACAKKDSGTSTGNPMVELTMTSSSNVATVAKNFFQFFMHQLLPSSYAKAPPNSMVDSQNNAIVITKFWISLGEIEFKFEENASVDESSEISFTGPYDVDMLSDSLSPLASNTISTNQFRRLKYKLKKFTTQPSAAPSGVLNNAIYIEGTVNSKPFIYTSSSEVEVTVSGATSVEAVNSSRILIQLQLANLIRKLNLSSITSSSTTTINESNRLNIGTNACSSIDSSLTDIYSCILKGLASESNIGRDDDKDGDLGSNETTVK